MTTDANPSRTRRWHQFGLRTLFIVVCIVSLAFAWLAHGLRNAKAQRVAVEAIERSGAEVAYDYQRDAAGQRIHDPEVGFAIPPPGPKWLRDFTGDDFFDEVVGIYWSGVSATDDRLAHVQPLTRLKFLQIHMTHMLAENVVNPHVTNAGLVHLRGLSKLHYLNLDYTAVTDEGLVHLSRLEQLERLYLGHTQITDAGLVHLRSLRNLKFVCLDGTAITDSALVHLQGFTQLADLRLGETQITDNGLSHLQSLRKLEQLSLVSTQITDDGLRRLQKMPSLKVVWFSDSKTTPEGRSALQRARPDLQVSGGSFKD